MVNVQHLTVSLNIGLKKYAEAYLNLYRRVLKTRIPTTLTDALFGFPQFLHTNIKIIQNDGNAVIFSFPSPKL
jgi:hypothetical protein